jgi:hypothetical protein
LTCANEVIVEDNTAGGVALFVTEARVELPATIELYDRDRDRDRVASHVTRPSGARLSRAAHLQGGPISSWPR